MQGWLGPSVLVGLVKKLVSNSMTPLFVYGNLSIRVHSWLGYYFWDKGLKDYVALDLGIYHDLLLFYQYILNR